MSSKPRFRWGVAFLVVCLVSVVLSMEADNVEKKKNVLILMSDEHSGRVMGCAGNKIVKTPNMDALAKSGMNFRRAYCQNPICVPARAALATGLMPSKARVFGNSDHPKDKLRDHPLSIARVFTSAGYTTEWLGKEHWGTTNAGLGFGNANAGYQAQRHATKHFKLVHEVGRLPESATTYDVQYITDNIDTILADKAIKWLQDYNDSRPFLLGLSLNMPHYPFLVETKYFDMYKDVIDLPRVTQQMIDDLPITQENRRRKYNFANLTDLQIKKARAVYYGMVTYIDDQVGRVWQELKDLGLQNDTIVVYLSDHGEHAGEHGVWYKNSFFEDSVGVPLMISHPPTLPAAKTYWSPVQLMDLAPTLYDICNINIPSGMDGKSLMPIVRGDEIGWTRHAISESSSGRRGEGRMVRRGRWKYCTYAGGRNQLFDLKKDSAEEFNLYESKKRSNLVKWLHRLAMKDFKSGWGNDPWKIS